MGHRSKRDVTPRQCPVCGMTRYEFAGTRTKCPYLELHRETPEQKQRRLRTEERNDL